MVSLQSNTPFSPLQFLNLIIEINILNIKCDIKTKTNTAYMFMIPPLDGSTSSVGYSRWPYFCKQPLLLLFAKTRQSRNKTQNILTYIFLSVAILAYGRSCALSCCIVHWNSLCHTFERRIYYTSASLFDAWPPSALLMAPFCCTAPIIQGVPPDFKYQNEEKNYSANEELNIENFLKKSLVGCNLFSFWYWKLGGRVKNTLYDAV